MQQVSPHRAGNRVHTLWSSAEKKPRDCGKASVVRPSHVHQPTTENSASGGHGAVWDGQGPRGGIFCQIIPNLKLFW